MDRQTTVTASSSLHAFVAACTIILVWGLGLTGVKIPPEISLAFQTVLAVAIHYFVSRDSTKTPSKVEPTDKVPSQVFSNPAVMK